MKKGPIAFLKDGIHARRGAGPVGQPGLGPEAALGSQLGVGGLPGWWAGRLECQDEVGGLRAGERCELAAHLPPEHAVGSGLSPGGEAGGLATLDQGLLQGGGSHVAGVWLAGGSRLGQVTLNFHLELRPTSHPSRATPPSQILGRS